VRALVPSVRQPLLFLLLACTAACSSTTDSSEPKTTHPMGVISQTSSFAFGVHGLAISRSGRVVVSQLYTSDVVAAPIKTFAFGPNIVVRGEPVDVAVTGDGGTAFVADLTGSTLDIVDLLADSVEESIEVRTPLRLLLTPNNRRLYITSSSLTDGTPSTVYVFDVRNRTLIDSITVGPVANGIAYDEALARLYVSTQGDATINEIDVGTDHLLRQLRVGGIPQDVAVTPDHSELWVADESAGVRVFDLASGTELDTIPGTSAAFGLAISPDGAQVYATQPILNNAMIIDRASRTVLTTMLTGSRPERVAFSLSGSNAVITDERAGVILFR
jgi:DNA-binding beta-propeller fold protein YncE